MATHSSVLAWRIPGAGEPGGLPSVGVTQTRTRQQQQCVYVTSKFLSYPSQHFLSIKTPCQGTNNAMAPSV